jgi:hypothetical protein
MRQYLNDSQFENDINEILEDNPYVNIDQYPNDFYLNWDKVLQKIITSNKWKHKDYPSCDVIPTTHLLDIPINDIDQFSYNVMYEACISKLSEYGWELCK